MTGAANEIPHGFPMSKERTTVVLFTFNPPLESKSEGAFLQVELEYLARKFDRLILVPQMKDQFADTLSLGEMDLSLAEVLQSPGSRFFTFLSALSSPVFRHEFSEWTSAGRRGSPGSLMRAYEQGQRINKWFDDFCKRWHIDISHTIFYTYWLDRVTFGLSLARQKQPSMILISRAHRADLYEEEEAPSYFPFRRHMLENLNALYLISHDGLNYISRKQPAFVDKYWIARLGVRSRNLITKSSPAGEMHIVSCSQLQPVKRVDLMARGIGDFAGQHPGLHIFWDHFGAEAPGPMALPPNVTAKFWGNVPNSFIIDFYSNHCVDVFLNTSSSEGIPVSIMEAIACGIPIVAPAVGGVTEIVGGQNGVLLNPDPSPSEIAGALKTFIPLSEGIIQRKMASLKIWMERYDADLNFDMFSSELAGLLER